MHVAEWLTTKVKEDIGAWAILGKAKRSYKCDARMTYNFDKQEFDMVAAKGATFNRQATTKGGKCRVKLRVHIASCGSSLKKENNTMTLIWMSVKIADVRGGKVVYSWCDQSENLGGEVDWDMIESAGNRIRYILNAVNVKEQRKSGYGKRKKD
jgi:hypothetical protein